jgi:hypothetical protein
MWRDGDTRYAYVGGTGSISCLGLTEEQGLAAERRRGPLGFHTVQEATRAAVAARAEKVEALVVKALAAAGEAAWTARDTFVIREYPDGRVEVV